LSAYAQQLEAAVEATGVTGASFAYWDGSTLHAAVAGVRNSVTRDPVTLDTVMHIGSITKLLNSVLLMQLVDDGRIELQDLVTRHVPELRLRDMSALSQITCAMLVNHTSGIDGIMLPDHGPDQERIVDAIARCEQLGQLHPPGGGPSYCNVATVVAGYLAQKLRGESWYTLIKTRIYEPLGMRHALADLTDLPRYRHSVGDLTDAETGELVQSRRAFLPLSFAPCGTTLMMTAADLVTFARALLSGDRILSRGAAAQMRTPTAAIIQPAGWHWGLGWLLLPNGLLFHSGGGPGVASVLYAHPQSGRVVALLTNCDRGHALRPAIVEPLLREWTGHELGAQTTHAAPPPALLDPSPYLGIFENHLIRAEIVPATRGLTLRLSTKSRTYDNSPVNARSYALAHVAPHVFEGPAIPGIPGSSRTEFRFASADARGRMGALGFMVHLLMRTA
jgi:CubicO group peptidase (beta-lactamase class C family)